MRRLAVTTTAVLAVTGCATASLPSAAPPLADALAPGVSLELARHRVATLSGVAYALQLDVTSAEHATGRVDISLQRSAGAGPLVLDFRGNSVTGVRVNNSPVTDFTWDRHHIVVPERHLAEGDVVVSIDFVAPIAPAGAAIIAYDDAQNDARYLYTLLVPSDAQLLFPVFDQPDIKARFTWTVIAPPDWTVLTNGALVSRATGARGGTRAGTRTGASVDTFRFAGTEPISSYVAAFAAGPWSTIEHAYDGSSDVARDMTLYVRPAVRDDVDGDTLITLNRNALAWLEQYFDMKYPFGKLDLLLAPAFPFGGMEHVGAIFYNESSFIFREPPTPSRRLGRAATIYHEVAHQWFGDLVTMQWFDDLWLKEGFSTFMAAKIQHELHVDGDAWKTFYLRNKPSAYGVDATAGTTPVWQELPNLDLAKSNYGAIVYNKAPSILKQLEFLVGEEPFRRGVQLFLRRHAFANATWQDLLAAISEASATDLTAFGEQYILRAGLPLIETELDIGDDGSIASLALVQRPARDMPGDGGGFWPGRVRVRLAYSDRADRVLDVTFAGERTVIDEARGMPAPDYVFANDGDYGYGIFLPDEHSADWLLRHTSELDDDLERAMAWGALWDLVREARLPPAHFVEAALPAFARERDEQIAGALLGRTGAALENYMTASVARERLIAERERILLARIDDASLDYGLRRGSLNTLLGSARSAAAVAVLKAYLAGAREFDGEPLGQPSRWSAVTRLLALGDADAAALLAAEQARDSTPEAGRMAFIAGAAVPTAAVKAAYWRRYFDDASLNEEWVTASLGAFNHELHADISIEYLRPALERAEWLRDNRRIFFLPRWLEAFIGGHSSADALRIIDEHLAANPDLPGDVRRRILQSRDGLERAVRIRAAHGG
ncbi:aminopeptidase N [soil metagenome]